MKTAKRIRRGKAGCFIVTEEAGGEKRKAQRQNERRRGAVDKPARLGDNCSFMKYLLDEKNMTGKIKLIYIDPPFFSKASYDAVISLYDSDGKSFPPLSIRHMMTCGIKTWQAI